MVVEAVQAIADRAYQERAWFNASDQVSPPQISSPEEVYCGLFDDAIFEDFLTDGSVCLTEQERAAGLLLVRALDNFSSHMSDPADPREVIDHPEWEKVRKIAQEFVAVLEARRVEARQ